MPRSKPSRADTGGVTCMPQDAEEGVVVADEHRRLVSGTRPGLSIVEALMSCPHKDVEIEPERITGYIVTRPVKF